MNSYFIDNLLAKVFGRKVNDCYTIYCPSYATFDSIDKTSMKDEPIIHNNGKVEATEYFNSQLVGGEKDFKVIRKVGKVTGCEYDYLSGNGKMSVKYKVTPLHVSDKSLNFGDYYIIDATYVIDNENMYHPNRMSRHKFVNTHIGGFCLETVNIETNLICKSSRGFNNNIKFATFPKPDEIQIDDKYSIMDGWYVDGYVTGGIVKHPNIYTGVNFNGLDNGVQHSNYREYNIDDLIINNNSDNSVVKFKLINKRVTSFNEYGLYGLSDCSDLAKNKLEFHASWIWHVPGIKDSDNTTTMAITSKIKPNYRSCGFYTNKSNYNEWDDLFEMKLSNELAIPIRSIK